MDLLKHFFSNYQWSYWGILTLILLIAAYSLLLVKNKKLCLWLRNWILIPLTAAGGFVIYFIGYLEEGSYESLVTLSIRSFISTFHMFLLHSDLIEVRHDMHGCDEYMVCFAVIHLMAFLITFMVVIQFFGKHALSWLRLKFSSPSESYVFFELNEASFALAKDLKAKRGKPFIVFLDKRLKSRADTEAKTKTLRSVFRRREPLFEQASKMDALLLNREYTESTTLSDVGIARLLRKGKSRLFFFSDNVEYNIQSAVKIIKEIGRMKSAAEKVEVYVKAEADYMIAAFEQGRPKNVNVHIVNSAKLAVTELALAHPPVDYVDIDERQATARQGFTMMIIGFGGVGGYALRYLTELGQFVGTESRAIVVDREMDGKRGEFEARFPGMSHYRVDYHGMTVGGTAYWKLIEENLERLNYIVISLGDTDLNMKTAVSLSRYALRKRETTLHIFVKAGNDVDNGYMRIAAQTFKGIHVFGSDESVFTERVIVNEARDRVARTIHDHYNQRKPSAERIEWDDLSVMKKITNVSAAMHIYTKLRLAGLTVEEVRAMPTPEAYWNALGTTRQENLAKGEHLHWNATLFANEWDTWNPVPIEAVANKDDRRKLHACLVDWDDLERVEKRFNTPYREYDRDSVRRIYELIRSGAYPEEQDTK